MTDAACPTCGGSRVVTVDMFTPSRGHFTIEEECPDCVSDDFDDREPEDKLSPLERGAPYVSSPLEA